MIRAFPILAAAALVLSACGDGGEQKREIEEQERRFGAEQHEALLAQFGGAYRGPEAGYMEQVGGEIASAAGLADQCTFTLVNTDVVNAFAVPGCYIYLTRGLMGLMNSEAQLAAVLAHEVGHIVADHSERQQQRSLLRQLGVLAVGLATESELLTRIAGGAAELFTLRYSRTHEHEADELAIRYLIEAGYDPFAAADMLDALARHERFQQAGGNDVHALPEWARTHPLTGNRIERVRAAAQATGVEPDALPEREAAFLDEVDGLLYGDDPEQGFVHDRRFAHPRMRIAFEVPPGYGLTNTPQAVLIEGPEGLAGEFSGGRMPRGGLQAYASGVIEAALGGRGRAGPAQTERIGGVPALIVPIAVSTEQGPVELLLAAFAGDGGAAYHFLLVAPPGQAMPRSVGELIGSFRRLPPEQAQALQPQVIDVVEVGPGTDASDLAAQMAGDRPLERLLMLNALSNPAELRPGQRVKLIRPGQPDR